MGATMNVHALVYKYQAQFKEIQKDGENSYNVCCPVHGDNHPSLHIEEDTSNGIILFHCLSQCASMGKMYFARLCEVMPPEFKEDVKRCRKDYQEKQASDYVETSNASHNITLETYALEKKLDVDFLLRMGLKTGKKKSKLENGNFEENIISHKFKRWHIIFQFRRSIISPFLNSI